MCEIRKPHHNFWHQEPSINDVIILLQNFYGSFKNYVDHVLPNCDPSLPWTTVDILQDAYPLSRGLSTDPSPLFLSKNDPLYSDVSSIFFSIFDPPPLEIWRHLWMTLRRETCLDKKILTGLLKGQNMTMHYQLYLSMVWDRVDIAEEKIFVHGSECLGKQCSVRWVVENLTLGVQN